MVDDLLESGSLMRDVFAAMMEEVQLSLENVSTGLCAFLVSG